MAEHGIIHLEELLECGHPESEHSDITRGYGKDPIGNRYCYDCCLARDLEQMEQDKVIGAYIAGDGKHVTNWPGFQLMTITGASNNQSYGFAPYTTYHYWAKDNQGNVWYGKNGGHAGGPGCYITMRQIKG